VAHGAGNTGRASTIDGEGQRVIERSDELIARISRGDADALEDLYLRNRSALLSYLRVLTSNLELAEEILQDTLYAVWSGAERFTGRSSGRTWLFAIARRRARDLLRRKSLPLLDVSALDTHPAIAPEPDDVVLAMESADALMECFDRLSAIHREVLMLTFVHGLSYLELSEVLAIPIGTVKSRLFAAKRELRRLLEAMEAAP
jgi:RNA polymerase sigma-70 factor (ECF subfamily)